MPTVLSCASWAAFTGTSLPTYVAAESVATYLTRREWRNGFYSTDGIDAPYQPYMHDTRLENFLYYVVSELNKHGAVKDYKPKGAPDGVTDTVPLILVQNNLLDYTLLEQRTVYPFFHEIAAVAVLRDNRAGDIGRLANADNWAHRSLVQADNNLPLLDGRFRRTVRPRLHNDIAPFEQYVLHVLPTAVQSYYKTNGGVTHLTAAAVALFENFSPRAVVQPSDCGANDIGSLGRGNTLPTLRQDPVAAAQNAISDLVNTLIATTGALTTTLSTGSRSSASESNTGGLPTLQSNKEARLAVVEAALASLDPVVRDSVLASLSALPDF